MVNHLFEKLRQRLEISARHSAVVILQFDVKILSALPHAGPAPRRRLPFLRWVEAR